MGSGKTLQFWCVSAMRLGFALQFESEECDLPMCGYTLQVADYVSLVSAF